jgi:hypothetical protein
MRSEPVDRLPVIEWANWWGLTLDRWRSEGLPANLDNPLAIRTWLGLDPYVQVRVPPRGGGFPAPTAHGAGVLATEADYEALRPVLYPPLSEHLDARALERLARLQQDDDHVVWLTVDGFFWFPRTLFGIESHLTAFYESPDLMNRMCEDLAEHIAAVYDAMCAYLVPDFMTFAEDMSFRNGPMISKGVFDAALAPHYRELVPMFKERGTRVFVDTDGLVTEPLAWYFGVGVEGSLPLERQAGCDPVALRERYPDALFIGGFDKRVMSEGEAAMRAEFEALLPAMRAGGYIPACDHQTPPAVSLAQYRDYVRLLHEYAQTATR